MKLINSFLIILAITGWIGCNSSQQTAELPDHENKSYQDKLVSLSKAQMETINLKLEGFARKNLNASIKATGNLELPPENMASVNTLMPGYVKKASWLIGDYVEKGQVLTVLENPDYIDLQQQLMEARSDLDFLKDELKRQETLASENINAGKVLVKTKSDYQKALAKYQGLSSKLEMIGITPSSAESGNFSSRIALKAPISGHLAEVNIKIGEFVTPERVLFEILDKSHMHLELKVYEQDVAKVSKGQQIEFTIPSQGDQTYAAEVFLVSQHLDPETRTMNVHGHVKDENLIQKLMVGTYVEANIVTEQKEVTALPENAVVKDGFHNYIFIKDQEDGEGIKFSRMAVEVGTTDQGFVAVTPQGELGHDAMVVTEGAFYLAGAMDAE